MKWFMIVLAVGILFISGCGSTPAEETRLAGTPDDGWTDTPDAAASGSDAPSGSSGSMKETIKSIFAKGMGLKCTYKAQMPDDEGKMIDVDATYYVKGQKASIAYTVVSAKAEDTGTWKMIVNETSLAMGLEGNPTMSTDGAPDCDWLIFDYSTYENKDSVPTVDEDVSLEEYTSGESGVYMDFKCEPAVVDDALFMVTGKTCTFESLFAGAMAGVDTSGIPEEYQ